MYEIEVELDDGDWLLQGFCLDRNDALACAIRMASGSKPRRCRVVSLTWWPDSGRLNRNTLLEAAGPEQIPRPTTSSASPGSTEIAAVQPATRSSHAPAPAGRTTRAPKWPPPARIGQWLLIALALLVGAPLGGALTVYLVLLIA
ncbi:hypothetical protein SAMN05216241_102338 [Limimonas halophila]|uniref:Uncharacterized protein n=1 Tax=Limimonas halophila TaxID=1082479 RepID=A0A1G7NW62_9PROT|nr:hypothetical protein [Limimonas halophila]SDF78276.1 hypothetical protein SAMN05216241_102338 [Limimonas halophila]